MVNPLFVGLVANVIRHQQGHGLAPFRDLMLDRLQQLFVTEAMQDLDWYADLRQHWLEELGEEEVEDLIPELETLVTVVSPADLYWLAVDLRNSILLEDQPRLSYPVESFQATFTVRWSDGTVSDYCCRPVINPGELELTPAFLYDLVKMFLQHMADYMCEPGLDGMHDQAAKPFDHDRLTELTQALHQHVNELPASEREPYQHIIKRIGHVLGKGPTVKLRAESQPALRWLDNGGGL